MNKRDQINKSRALGQSVSPDDLDRAGYGDIRQYVERAGQIDQMRLHRDAVGGIDTLIYGNIRMSQMGLMFTSEYSLDDWLEAGQIITTIQNSIQWWIGDWMTAIRDEWRRDAQMFISEQTGLNPDTLSGYEWVCHNVRYAERVAGLSFSHHQIVAAMDNRHELLMYALQEGLSVRGFKTYLQSLTARGERPQPYPTQTLTLGFEERVSELKKYEKRVAMAIGGNREARREVVAWVDEMQNWLNEIRRIVNE